MKFRFISIKKSTCSNSLFDRTKNITVSGMVHLTILQSFLNLRWKMTMWRQFQRTGRNRPIGPDLLWRSPRFLPIKDWHGKRLAKLRTELITDRWKLPQFYRWWTNFKRGGVGRLNELGAIWNFWFASKKLEFWESWKLSLKSAGPIGRIRPVVTQP